VRAFAHAGVALRWKGEGVDETGVCVKTGKTLVRIDAALFRPKEVHHLLGDAGKARAVLGWKPKVTFDQLVSEMVNAAREHQREEEGAWRMVS
jgi:GDPmannose 4,6-dehydratase